MILALVALDIPVTDSVISGRDGLFFDNWQFTQNASWDSKVFHSGSHSGKIEIPGNENKISGIWKNKLIPAKPNTTYLFSAWVKAIKLAGLMDP